MSLLNLNVQTRSQSLLLYAPVVPEVSSLLINQKIVESTFLAPYRMHAKKAAASNIPNLGMAPQCLCDFYFFSQENSVKHQYGS